MLYTIGHSTRTFAALVEVLGAWQVETLIDIRSITRSRANPQFNRDRLVRMLPRRVRDHVRRGGVVAMSSQNRHRRCDPHRLACRAHFTATKIERARRTPFSKVDRKTGTLLYPHADE